MRGGATPSVLVHPLRKLSGELEVPGDKSLSHRVAMVAACLSGSSRIKGFLNSEDCLNTLQAMRSLGATILQNRYGELIVEGTGGKFMNPAKPLDLGNSGTGMRLLTGLLAGRSVHAILTGDESLKSRPMGRIQELLRRMGANIKLLGEGQRPPIEVVGTPLSGITYTLPVASAQVKSAILLAALSADGKTVVEEPVPTRDHTENLLRSVGASLSVDGLSVTVEGYGASGPSFSGRNWIIPGDFSSAAFWMVAAAGKKHSSLKIKNIGLNPRRTALVDVLKRMGAQMTVTVHPERSDQIEPVGDILVRGGHLRGTRVGGSDIANIIDELPLVAVAGAIAEGQTVIEDAGELRVKETDRIAAMTNNLRIMGVEVEEKEDGMIISGTDRIRPRNRVKSFGDHRVAMAMAVLALYAAEPTCINETACTETSYPGFWRELERMGRNGR